MFKESAYKTNKKAQLTLSNPRDVKACKNYSNYDTIRYDRRV